MWFAENKSWSEYRRSLGGFSAIVCKDGSTVWAEDASGKSIASGESGVDDASVIQSALDIGGIVRIREGKYFIDKDINLVSNLVLIGDGIGKTIFKKVADVHALKGYNVENVVLQDFMIDGQGYKKRAILFDSSGDKPLYNITIKRVKTYNNYGHHIYFTGTDSTLENTYRNVVIERVECHLNPEGSIATNPILLLDYVNGVVLRDCYVHEVANRADGCIGLGGKNIWVYDCIAEEGYEGIRVETGPRDIKNINIIGGRFSYNNTGIFLYPDTKEVVIRGARLERNYGAGVGFYGTGAQQKIDIFDCWFIENGYPESATTALSVNGDSVYEVRIERCKFINNNFATGESRAISILKGDKITIKDNLIIDDRDTSYLRWGIEFRSGTITNVVCENNRIYGAYEKAIVRTYGATVSGIFRRNIADASIDLKSENSGTATFSGDGATTQFSIAHGLVSTPTKVLVTPMTADAASDFYVTADDTNIYINYKSAPPSGTDNLKFSWFAEV